MKTLLQRQVDLATAHGPRWVSDRRSLLRALAIFAALILGPMAVGVCGCSMLAIGSLVMVVGAALLVGNSAITALAEEREKKTLVFLRLTLLSAPQVMLLKLVPEFLVLRSLLLVTAPVVLVAGLLSDGGLFPALHSVMLAAGTGVFAAASGIFLSTMFQNRSKAVVGGWVFKAVWLLLTPLFDVVVAALLVQTTPPPIFATLNPLEGWFFQLVPEAANQAQHWIPTLALPVMGALSVLLVLVAARRFDAGHIVGNIVGDEQMHPVYQNGWGPSWLQQRFPSFRHNPLFLRELAVQMRGGAGRWPGYAVFAVLFLAPFVYARLWAVKPPDTANIDMPRLSVTSDYDAPRATEHIAPTHVSLQAVDGTQLVLIGHRAPLCLRLFLNQSLGIALPPSQVREVSVAAGSVPDPVPGQAPGNSYVTSVTGERVTGMALRAPDADDAAAIDLNAINHTSLAWGFTGAVFMLLVYLGIRCSGFLASAVTGERERRSWEDLALTSQQPSEAMFGKVLGTLLMPILQMTLTFPLLFFFVFNGSLSIVEVGFLYVYAVCLAVAAGLLGLWSSTVSGSSHEAHARALFLGLLVFVVSPTLMPLAFVVAIGVLARAIYGLLSGAHRTETAAWFGVGSSLLLIPAAASPMTAVLAFMPSLSAAGTSVIRMFEHSMGAGDPYLAFMASVLMLVSLSVLMWRGVVRRLHEPDAETAIRMQFAEAR